MRRPPLPLSLADFLAQADRFEANPAMLDTALLAWLARGLDLDAPLQGQTLLHRAVATQRTWLVEGLVRQGANPMAVSHGQPAFRAAVYWNETQSVLALLGSGRVDLHHTDASGATALHDAAANGNTGLLDRLIAAGGPALRPNAQGLTALDVYARAYGTHALAAHQQNAQAALVALRPRALEQRLEHALPSPSLPRPRLRM